NDIAILTEWVQIGAPWPGAATPPPPPRVKGFEITAADRAAWAFRPVVRPKVPLTRFGPIDAFLTARLQEKGLAFAPLATRRELIRRAHFDLLGLPPAPEQVEAFVRDHRPDAYERLLDQL